MPPQTGVKSNLPRDDINLQFCRGVLKERRSMLEDLKVTSIRRKSLLDPQTILLLKSQEESHLYLHYRLELLPHHSNSRVDDRTNFWRRAAINDQKEPKPQIERNPEWLTEYQKNNLGSQQKTSNGKHKYNYSASQNVPPNPQKKAIYQQEKCLNSPP